MNRASALGALLWCVTLVACDEEPPREPQAAAGDAAEEAVWSFRPPAAVAGADLADRLPASPGMTALIPATGLFPGATAVAADVPNPYAGDEQAIAAGGRHFAAFNCSGCHAPLGGGGMGPPLSDGAWIHGGAPGQIYLSIVHGRADGMPAWGAMLPEKTIWKIVAYIETLDRIEQPARREGFPDRSGGLRPAADDSQAEDADDTAR